MRVIKAGNKRMRSADKPNTALPKDRYFPIKPELIVEKSLILLVLSLGVLPERNEVF